MAADHRDPDQRLALERHAPRLDPPAGGWLRQALASGSVVRLSRLEQADIADAGLPHAGRIGEVAIVPIVAGDAVIVAVRDRVSPEYSAEERAVLQRIAAASGAWSRERR